MRTRRSIGNLIALALLAAASLVPYAWLAAGLRYVALGYIFGHLLLRARAGYRCRRPYWTSDSWRRYLKACSIPVGALMVMVLMMTALEWKLPIVGASRSTTRGLWAASTIAVMVIGAFGLVTAIEWLNVGEPSRQFALPKWLRVGRRKSA